MVLGPKTFSRRRRSSKLRHVPEFVFINCCHLGAMKEEVEPRWGELAANLATQFIQMGCKAVIAAGWAVDDRAATTFAQTFYAAMFAGQALWSGGAAGACRHLGAVIPSPTPGVRSRPTVTSATVSPTRRRKRTASGESGHPSHLIADLDMLSARLEGATDTEKRDFYRAQIEAIERSARGPISATPASAKGSRAPGRNSARWNAPSAITAPR